MSFHVSNPNLHIKYHDPFVDVSMGGVRGGGRDDDVSYSSTSREMKTSICPKSEKASYE